MLRRVAGTELAAIICLIDDLVCFKLLFYFSSLPFVSFILLLFIISFLIEIVAISLIPGTLFIIANLL